MSTFTTTLLGAGTNKVGIEIPDDVVVALGGKRVPVRVTVDGYTYRSTTAVMGGSTLVGLNSEHRAATGLAGGDTVEVTIVRDDTPRTVEVPDVLAAALAADPRAAAAWEKLPRSRHKEHVRQLVEAKAEDTRDRRLAKILSTLRGD